MDWRTDELDSGTIANCEEPIIVHKMKWQSVGLHSAHRTLSCNETIAFRNVRIVADEKFIRPNCCDRLKKTRIDVIQADCKALGMMVHETEKLEEILEQPSSHATASSQTKQTDVTL